MAYRRPAEHVIPGQMQAHALFNAEIAPAEYARLHAVTADAAQDILVAAARFSFVEWAALCEQLQARAVEWARANVRLPSVLATQPNYPSDDYEAWNDTLLDAESLLEAAEQALIAAVRALGILEDAP